MVKPLDGARYKEFQKEEKRRSVGQGSAKGTPKDYNGSASQAYMVDDNSAHKITARATSPHSSLPMRGPAPSGFSKTVTEITKKK